MIYFSLENSYLKKKFPDFTYFVTYFKKLFSKDLAFITINNASVNLYLYTFNLDIFFFLKKNHLLQYKQLVDIITVDHLRKINRFVVIYSLVSLKYNFRLNLYCPVTNLTGLPTLTKLYASAT